MHDNFVVMAGKLWLVKRGNSVDRNTTNQLTKDKTGSCTSTEVDLINLNALTQQKSGANPNPTDHEKKYTTKNFA